MEWDAILQSGDLKMDIDWMLAGYFKWILTINQQLAHSPLVILFLLHCGGSGTGTMVTVPEQKWLFVIHKNKMYAATSIFLS